MIFRIFFHTLFSESIFRNIKFTFYKILTYFQKTPLVDLKQNITNISGYEIDKVQVEFMCTGK